MLSTVTIQFLEVNAVQLLLHSILIILSFTERGGFPNLLSLFLFAFLPSPSFHAFPEKEARKLQKINL
jgi:hypothetical protein